MNNFFTTDIELGGKIPLPLFGPIHLTWLILATLIFIAASTYYKKLDTPKRLKMVQYIAYSILFLQLSRNLILMIRGYHRVSDIPLHLCGASVFISFIQSRRPSNILNDAMFMLVMPGALAALLFPDWNIPIHFNFYYLHSWIIHILLVLIVVIQLAGQDIKPDIKNMKYVASALALYALPVYFINKTYGTNFLFINAPSPGSPLEPLEALFGNPGYIIAFIVLVFMVWFLLYILNTLLSKTKANQII